MGLCCHILPDFCLFPPSKKKKITMGPAAGIYNGNVNTQMPMQPRSFRKGARTTTRTCMPSLTTPWYTGIFCRMPVVLPPGRGGHLPALPGPRGTSLPPPPPTNSRAPTVKLATDEPALAPLLSLESETVHLSHPQRREGQQQEHRQFSAGCPMSSHGSPGNNRDPPKDLAYSRGTEMPFRVPTHIS